jgi:tetratricopeptide (TPR) repeat protein
MGNFLRVRGKVAESIALYRKALEVDPKSTAAWTNLSVALLALGKWDESDEATLTAVRFGVNDPEAAIYRRVAHYLRESSTKKGARAQVIGFLRKAIAASPENDHYRSSLGKLLFEDQACEESRRIFSELTARRPADTESLNLFALSAWCAGDAEQARELFRRSLAIDPKQEVARRGLAELPR